MGPDTGEKLAPVKTVMANELWAGNLAKPIRVVSNAGTAFILDLAQRHCQFSKNILAKDDPLKAVPIWSGTRACVRSP